MMVFRSVLVDIFGAFLITIRLAGHTPHLSFTAFNLPVWIAFVLSEWSVLKFEKHEKA